MKRTLPFLGAAIALLMVSTLHAQTTVISGRLLGYDSKPMPKAHVHLATAQGRGTIVSVATDKDGGYRLETTARGYFSLQFTGAHHQMTELNVLLGDARSIGVDATLATNHYPEKFEDVKIIGDFNDFDMGGGVAMTKHPDGTWSAEFPTRDKTFRYQILANMPGPNGSVAGRSFNGTQSNDFEYDGGGDYRSVVNVSGGKAKITFNPKRLVTSDHAANLDVRDDATKRLQTLLADINTRSERFYSAMRARMSKGEDLTNFKYVDSTIGDLAARVRTERDPATRRERLFEYLVAGSNGADLDSSLAQEALETIEPTSALWAIDPSAVFEGVTSTGQPTRFMPYARSVAFTHPDTAVRVRVMSNVISESYYKKDTATLREFFTALVRDFPNNYSTQYASDSYGPDRKVQVGRPIPHFTVTSLDDPSVIYTDASMKGKVYLIDFWATWCGPCISEMGNLHAAYEKYKGRNFEILSLSFDGEPTIIGKFRSKKWKMPWLHTFVDGGFKSDMARSFEVSGIPKPVLVGADGTILATSEDLRGAQLGVTLARIFDQPN